MTENDAGCAARTIDLSAPGNRRHDRDIITVLHRCCIFLQVSDVLIVEVNVYESPQFTFICIQMAAQIRMQRHQFSQCRSHSFGIELHRACFPAYWRKGVGMWILAMHR